MKNILKKLRACEESVEWVGDRTPEQAYNDCPRGDWLLWLFQRTNPEDLQLLVLATGHCANTVRHLMTDSRSTNAVDVTIAFGGGRASKEELDAARVAARDATTAVIAAATTTATTTATATSFIATYTAYATATYTATYAATYTAYATADDAADAAADAAAYADADAKKENQRLTADICRKHLPFEIWNLS
jgi:hypothetical protein